MNKTINSYTVLGTTFTAADIQSRSSHIGGEAVVGNDVAVTDIKISEVRSVLGESVNNLKGLNQSANINKYSNFSPFSIEAPFNSVVFNNTAPFNLGDFACYNKDAVTPSIGVVGVEEGGTILIHHCNSLPEYGLIETDIHLGEIDYEGLYNGVNSFVVQVESLGKDDVFQPAILADFTKISNNDIQVSTSVTIDLEGVTELSSREYTMSAYFTDGGNKKIYLPAASFSFNVRARIDHPTIDLNNPPPSWQDEGECVTESLLASWDAVLHSGRYLHVNNVYVIGEVAGEGMSRMYSGDATLRVILDGGTPIVNTVTIQNGGALSEELVIDMGGYVNCTAEVESSITYTSC